VSAQEEYADPRAVMAITHMIGPDLSEEEAMRLLYPKAAAEIYTPWHRSHMKKEKEIL